MILGFNLLKLHYSHKCSVTPPLTGYLLRRYENHTSKGFCLHIKMAISKRFLLWSESAPRRSRKWRFICRIVSFLYFNQSWPFCFSFLFFSFFFFVFARSEYLFTLLQSVPKKDQFRSVGNCPPTPPLS